MSNSELNKQAGSWAPWYHYVWVLAVGNAAAQTVLHRVNPVANTISTVALCVVLFVLVTLVWRTRRHV